MTRREFIDEITTFSELKDLCYEEGCYELDEYFDGSDFENYANDDLYEYVRDGDRWDYVRDALNALDDSYDFYYRNGMLDYTGFTRDDGEFDDLKQNVLEWMDDNERWDDEEDEEEEEESEEENAEIRENFDALWWGDKEKEVMAV